jgi:hypothetical protein
LISKWICTWKHGDSERHCIAELDGECRHCARGRVVKSGLRYEYFVFLRLILKLNIQFCC